MRSRLPHSAGVRSGAAGEAVFFDEFKGNAGGERFQCIITDPLNRRIFGILPSRTAETVQDYLHSFPNRDEVKCVIMDMNRGFRDVAKAFLPNAKTVINRFHVARYCTGGDGKHPQKLSESAPQGSAEVFKRARRLLLAHCDRLSEEERAAVDVMLRFSGRLLQAYALKEGLLRLHGRIQPGRSRTPTRFLARSLRPSESPRV